MKWTEDVTYGAGDNETLVFFATVAELGGSDAGPFPPAVRGRFEIEIDPPIQDTRLPPITKPTSGPSSLLLLVLVTLGYL